MSPENITIYDARERFGGALEAFGSEQDGYMSPGAREPEPYFECLRELCRRVPSLDDASHTILDEMVEFNKKYPIFCSTLFLENQGHKQDQTKMGLDPKCRKEFMRLTKTPNEQLENLSLEDIFS